MGKLYFHVSLSEDGLYLRIPYLDRMKVSERNIEIGYYVYEGFETEYNKQLYELKSNIAQARRLHYLSCETSYVEQFCRHKQLHKTRCKKDPSYVNCLLNELEYQFVFAPQKDRTELNRLLQEFSFLFNFDYHPISSEAYKVLYSLLRDIELTVETATMLAQQVQTYPSGQEKANFVELLLRHHPEHSICSDMLKHMDSRYLPQMPSETVNRLLQEGELDEEAVFWLV